MKEIKVEWCENFIKAAFGTKHHPFAGNPKAGIEVNLFWKKAQAAGLWEPGIYGGPMSVALEELTNVVSVLDKDGRYAYSVFRLKEVRA